MRSVNTCTRLTTRRDPSWTSITVIMDSGPRGGGFAQQWDDAMWLSHGAVWVFSLFPRRVGRCELEARWLLFRCHPGCALALHWLRQIKKQIKQLLNHLQSGRGMRTPAHPRSTYDAETRSWTRVSFQVKHTNSLNCTRWTHNVFWSLCTACPQWPPRTERPDQGTLIHRVSVWQTGGGQRNNCAINPQHIRKGRHYSSGDILIPQPSTTLNYWEAIFFPSKREQGI